MHPEHPKLHPEIPMPNKKNMMSTPTRKHDGKVESGTNEGEARMIQLLLGRFGVIPGCQHMLG